MAKKPGLWIPLVLLVPLVIVTVFWLCRGTRDGKVEPAGPHAVPAPESPGEQGVAALPAPAPPESAVDSLPIPLDDPVSRRNQQAAANRTLLLEELNAIREKVFAEEDKVFLSTPSYQDCRDDMLAEARLVLERINVSNVDAVMQAAQAELDEFWNKGGLSVAESYSHGYLAEAILELALEKHPEDFKLLGLYKEAISTMTPGYIADEKADNDPKVRLRMMENRSRIFSVVDRQKGLITSGKVPLSPDAVLAMVDWASYAPWGKMDMKASAEGYKWLVENADACGCGSLKSGFEQALPRAEQGLGASGFQMYVRIFKKGENPLSEDSERERAKHLRRIPSFKGSPDHRANIVPAWEYKDN